VFVVWDVGEERMRNRRRLKGICSEREPVEVLREGTVTGGCLKVMTQPPFHFRKELPGKV